MNKQLLNEQKWTKRSQSYDEKRFDYFRTMQKIVIQKMEIKEKYSYLDLGCGTGWALMQIFEQINGDGIFKGIDISKGMVEIAKKKSEGQKNIEFLEGDSEKLLFQNMYFDRALCTNSFHHYPNPQKVIDEISRVLKIHGKCFILDVTRDDIIIDKINKHIQKIENEHVSFYSSKEYKVFFEAAGLLYYQERVGIFKYPLKIHIGEKVNNQL